MRMTMTTTLVPKDMLDATQVVNGPEDGPCDWEQVRWLAAEENVRRLRQRIFTATQAGKHFCPPAEPKGLA